MDNKLKNIRQLEDLAGLHATSKSSRINGKKREEENIKEMLKENAQKPIAWILRLKRTTQCQ